jgi:uncharacterized protein YndB with AHSA1/START domain
LAEVVEWVIVAASPEKLLSLIANYSQRYRFLPDGWRVLRLPNEETTGIGSRMEMEARFGPGTTPRVVQILEMGDDFVTEGPPSGDNFLATWLIEARGEDTIVQVEVLFKYGGLIGEHLARRGLRRDLRQQLQRLKTVAETRE